MEYTKSISQKRKPDHLCSNLREVFKGFIDLMFIFLTQVPILHRLSSVLLCMYINVLPEKRFPFPTEYFFFFFFQNRTSSWLLLLAWPYLHMSTFYLYFQATSLSWYKRQSDPEEGALDRQSDNSGF